MSRVPAEWAPHRAMWLGFPSHNWLWREDLAEAQGEVAALARALAGPGGEQVRLLTGSPEGLADAQALLGGVAGVEILKGRFGDIWLRDTGPIFQGDGTAAAFRFNGWGGKYVLEGDETVAAQIAHYADARLLSHDFVLEGGALDHDGEGTILTTTQCLLHPNRNRGWTRTEVEDALQASLGARKVVWLGDGLLNDHTDGHVDNLARFVAKGVVACPVAFGSDPNARVYNDAADRLAKAGFSVARIPSPGLIEEEDEIIPASHMNFLIANKAVIVPIHAPESGEAALAALRPLFPGREMIGLPTRAILTGGGSFHCISQQEPS